MAEVESNLRGAARTAPSQSEVERVPLNPEFAIQNPK